jgi:hypothetical protein
MSQNHSKVHAALAIACLALALSIYAAVRRPSGGESPATHACIDPEARDQVAVLRRALAERDALVGRLARAADAAGDGSNVAGKASPPGERSRGPETPSDPGRRRYAHFETPNPAVSVTQNADGSYDIRTTDSSLAGSIMQITAVTPSGEEDKVFVRIPQ